MNINIQQIHFQCTHDVVKGIYNTVIPNLGNSYISKVLHSHRYTDLIQDALNCNISLESFDHGVKPHVDTGQRQIHWCVLTGLLRRAEALRFAQHLVRMPARPPMN